MAQLSNRLSTNIKNPRLVAFRFGIVVALLGILIYARSIDLALLSRIFFAHPGILILGTGTVLTGYMAATMRWWLILHSQGFSIRYRSVFKLHLTTIFSSVFIPGGTFSLDALRVLLLMRMVPRRHTQAALATFSDGFVAALGLSFWAAILALSQRPLRSFEPGSPLPLLNIIAVLSPLGLVMGAWAAWLIVRTTARGYVNRRQTRIAKIVVVLADFCELFRQKRAVVVVALGVSVLATGLSLVAIVIVSNVALVAHLSAWNVMYAASLSQFASALPISPSGIGVGEAAFNQICLMLSPNTAPYPYATILLGYRIIGILVAAIGGTLTNIDHLTTPSD